MKNNHSRDLPRALSFWQLSFKVCLAVFVFSCAATHTDAAWAQTGNAVAKAPQVRQGELLVKFNSGARGRAANDAHAKVGAKVARTFHRIGWQHVRLPKGMTTAQGIAAYKKLAGVMLVEPDYIYRADVVPNDTSFGSLWGMTKIGAPAAWNLHTGDATTVVAVIDSGVDYTHPDLQANMWRNLGETPGNNLDDDGNGYVDDVYGIDADNSDSDPMDGHSHGTHCAGTIGAVGNNGLGVAGVNWNTRIMALRFTDNDGYGTTSGAIACLNYVATMKSRGVNIRVTSNSWGGGLFSQALKDAFDVVGNAGIINVCAAGNNGSNNDTYAGYPAGFDSAAIISVAASDGNDAKAAFSNYGATSVDLAAPGVGILSTVPGGGYGSKDGTSMATPHVAGAVALLLGAQPSLTIADVKLLLQNTTDQLPQWSGVVAWGGRLNLARALASVDATFISANNVSVAEGAGSTRDAVFTVRLSRAGSSDFAVAYSTTDGSARAGNDYTATSGTLTFAHGETNKQVRVPIRGDGTYERDETFTLNLTSSANNASAVGTITNDDVAVASSGRIVFASYRDGNYEIYAMKSDGSGVSNLTHNSATDVEPTLSRDGSKIAFISNREGNYEIYVMNADGTGQTRLTTSGLSKSSPAFSPDGTRIAYEVATDLYGPQIWVMNADGSGATNISGSHYSDREPAWSPDGSKIVIAAHGDDDFYYYSNHLVLMNADGSGRVQLTSGAGEESSPTFSPDGTQIAFAAMQDVFYGYAPQIYTINTDGSQMLRVTNDNYYNSDPVFSPDGNQLAFVSYRNGNSEIYTVFLDGTHPVNISNNWSWDDVPAWAPSTPVGLGISGRVVNANGTGLRDVMVTRTLGGASASVYSNSNGDYAFWGVPAGTYTVRPSRADTTFTPFPRTIAVGTTSVVGKNFTGTSPFHSISGAVSNSTLR